MRRRALSLVVVACSALLGACGTDANRSPSATPLAAMRAASHLALLAETPLAPPTEDPPSSDCAAIQAQLEQDAAAMRATPEFAAMSKTMAFRKFAMAAQLMQLMKCEPDSEEPQSPQCKTLIDQTNAAFVALRKTPEWEALEATSEFKTFVKTSEAVQDNNCN